MSKSRLKNYRFIAGAAILIFMLLIALFSIVWTPYGISKVSSSDRLSAPSLRHLFGTDNLGRDVFSRVMVGIRTTLAAAAGIVGIGAFFGILIGGITGYFGGIADEIIMRLNDSLASFPSILLAMVCVAVFGTGTGTVILVLGVLFIPSFSRVVRSEFIREKEKDYVKNIRLHGASTVRIMFRHILPNIRETLVSAIAIGINNAILAESGLSYLGLGVQPPIPSLGRMMSEGQTFIFSSSWICVFPGIMIMLIVMGASLISDGVSNTIRSELSPFITKKMRKYLNPDEAEPVDLKGSGTGASQAENILTVKNLHVVVDPVNTEEVVHGISFSLSAGEALGIVGESGSGKSISVLSILNLINGKGIYRADSIDFMGKELAGASEEEINALRGSEIAMVFQEPMTALDPGKKIDQLIYEVILRKKAGRKTDSESLRKRAEEALAHAGLTDIPRILSSYPHELSGGQRQRVLIAMAMINSPKLLILDEPTTALDADVAEKIIDFIDELHDRRELSVIFISHDIGITKRFCDKMLVMKDGYIVEYGTTEKITENPENAYTKELIAAGGEKDYKKIRAEQKSPTVTVKENEKSESIIEVSDLSVTYYGKKGSVNKVIDGLSFNVEKGECFGISGESGSGKTTILKALCKHIPYEGKIVKRGTYSMVFQDPYSSLNPSMRVGSLLTESLALTEKWMVKRGIISVPENENRKDRKKRYRAKVRRILEDVELSEEFASRYPHELSGGQRQRVAIAMAIIGNPDIIFLDEPVTALDVTIQARIMTLLNRLMIKKNLTYIMISHDAKLLDGMCDKVMRL